LPPLRSFRLTGFLSFLLLIVWTGPAYALDISDVRFGAHGEKTRMVLDMD
jgi:hypothetical protein